MDMEKVKVMVIKALEFCTDQSTFDTCYGKCPYAVAGESYKCLQMKLDALAVIKEQEAKIERLKRPDCEHANHDGAGCLGYCGCEQDDEPIDACKQCEKYTGNICAEY